MNPSCSSGRKGALDPEPTTLTTVRAVPRWFLVLTHQPLGYTGTHDVQMSAKINRAFKGTVALDGFLA
jgi:hypothetical protein